MTDEQKQNILQFLGLYDGAICHGIHLRLCKGIVYGDIVVRV